MFAAGLCLSQARLAGVKCKDLRLLVVGKWLVEPRLGWRLVPAPSHVFSPSPPLPPQVALCFSPVGSRLRVRSRRFPAIVSCVAIDWFQEWPREALESVSLRFLRETEAVEVSSSPAIIRAAPGLGFLGEVPVLATHGCTVLAAAACGFVPLFMRAVPHTVRRALQSHRLME